MTTLLPILAVAFAAFCVWLAVRIVNRCKKPGWVFWATVVLVLIYVVSFGPVCWYVGRPGSDDTAFNEFSPTLRALYWPLGRIIYRRVPAAAPALIWYARLGLVDGCFITVPGQPDDTEARLIFWIPD